MDGNKDEAQKCLRIGREALESGDRARAQKFISKARRLDPTLDVDDLLASFTAEDVNPPSPNDSSSSAAAPSSTQSGQPPPPSPGDSANGSSSRTYTDDQVAVVRQIKKQKDYYAIMGLEKGCSVEDVRKAYRKLSLKVHPDKNKAPGAEEAFKAVSKAFQCLSNEESRKKYDLLGTEEPTYDRPSARSHHYNGFYDADIDADEIFRNFFFGMPQGGTPFGVYRFRTGRGASHHHGEAQSSGPFNFRILAQVLPVLLLLVLNFLSSPDPIYSLQRSHPYILRVDTSKGVPYYVKSEAFHQDYPQQSTERLRLEDRIERDYFSILASNCRAELQRLQWGFSYQTPHCDMLKKFETV
ncbi:Chaperone protein dnaJ 49 [Nymphaea thermarum]|nr:Chaperone protein dnaJ 49 [Nymphaea thermarum]